MIINNQDNPNYGWTQNFTCFYPDIVQPCCTVLTERAKLVFQAYTDGNTSVSDLAGRFGLDETHEVVGLILDNVFCEYDAGRLYSVFPLSSRSERSDYLANQTTAF